MKNRAISILLVAALLGSTAASANDIKDSFLSSTTSAGSWDDPMSGTSYHYGGGAVYKFKDRNHYPLLVDYRMPGWSGGCNGISFDGGFLALLGLDDLADQLSDAGTSAAYGVMLGLLMSTPTIGDAFKKIREWAQTIQKFAQNACQIATNMTLNATGGQSSTTVTNWVFGEDDPVESTEILKSADAFFEKVDDFVDGCSGGPAACGKAYGSAIQEMLGKDGEKPTGTANQVPTARSILACFPKDVDSLNAGISTTLAKYWANKEISQGSKVRQASACDAEEFAFRQLSSKIGYLLFGDLAVNAKYVDDNLKIYFDEGEVKKDALKTMMKTNKDGSKTPGKPSISLIEPMLTNTDVAADVLINGLTADVFIPNYDLFYLDLEVSRTSGAGETSGAATAAATPVTDAPTRIEAMFVMGTVDDTDATNPALKLQWQGSKMEALKAIRAIVAQESGIVIAYTGPGSIATAMNTDPASIDTNIAPMIFPSIAKYAKTLGKLEKKAGKETPYTFTMKNLLSNYVAAQTAMAIIDFGYTRIRGQYADIGTSDSATNDTVMQTNLEQLTIRRDALVKAVSDSVETDLKSEELLGMFERMEKKIQIDTIEGMK